MSQPLPERLVAGHRALVLENAQVRAVVIPSLGGRVWELEDRARGVQWVWHRPGVPLVASAPGAEYDAVWAGGWEELFPNDAAGPFEGRDLPDHGEWWTLPWTVEASGGGDEPFVRLVAETASRRAACVKEFRLPAGQATVEARYEIRSLEPEPFHFLFKQHLPLALSPACRLVVPAGTVTPVDPAFGGGTVRDLGVVLPASSAAREFVYVSPAAAGWCGADDPARDAAIRMHWDLARLPHLWLFITYGGWRDCHTVVVEPCTNVPKDLAGAVARGQAARLEPGATFRTSVRVTLSSLAGAAR